MIYLDNNSTTQVDERVLTAMLPFFTSQYGNASSNHAFGVSTNSAVKNARDCVSQLVSCAENELIFTSGATEAINIALKGVAHSYRDKGNHIITVETEHPAVLDTCKSLEQQGFTISYLPVNSAGLIDVDVLKAAIKPTTILVSVMLANNETGTMQPIKEIAEISHNNGIFFMADGTQAVGKVPVDVQTLGIDLMAFSAHKFHGPKGIGALYIKGKRPFKVSLPAVVHGGGHERGIRSGTLNVPAIVGFGEIAKIAIREMDQNREAVTKLRDLLEGELLKIPGTWLNGASESRMYNVTNIRFEETDADALIASLTDVMISNGSACSSMKVEPSHVLTAMGLNRDECFSSVRLSLSKFNTKDEIELAIKKVREAVNSIRSLSLKS